MQTAALSAVPLPAGPESSAMEQDRKLVDRIVYLASLASERGKIDPMLDTLRVTTATWQPNQTLPPEKRAALQEVEAKLTHYLLREDPLRAFTPGRYKHACRSRSVRRPHDRSLRQLFACNYCPVVGCSFIPGRNPALHRSLVAFNRIFCTNFLAGANDWHCLSIKFFTYRFYKLL